MGLKHQAERAAFGAVANSITKNLNKDLSKNLLKVINLTETFAGDRFQPASYESARKFASEPDSKWMKYIESMLKDLHPNVLNKTIMNLGFEAMLNGTKIMHENRKKYNCNIPWLILFDPTSACNLHCTGCWAAEYGHKMNLTYDELDSIVAQGKELGVYVYMMTGGEPLVRKDDIIKLCEKHNDCFFNAYTNGTLVDEQLCKDMQRVGNLALSLSLEGFEEVNDGRRGAGVFNLVMHAMDLLKEHGLLFGTSICYTSQNMETVTSDKFYDMIIEKGVKYSWYFHYMPVGNDAAPELMPSKEQREYAYHRIREVRGTEGGKQIFCFDFQNDGEYVGGCIAGGRNYFHINSNGDVEPCVFIHYSDSNIREKTILESLQSPLFMAYHNGQPFNENHLRPCPMLENPEKIKAMVHSTNTHSTDFMSPEDVDHLTDKTFPYADQWTPKADELWAKSQALKAEKKEARDLLNKELRTKKKHRK